MISCTSPSDSVNGLPISRVRRRARASLLASTRRPACWIARARRGGGGGRGRARGGRGAAGGPAGGEGGLRRAEGPLGDDVVEVGGVAGGDDGVDVLGERPPVHQRRPPPRRRHAHAGGPAAA